MYVLVIIVLYAWIAVLSCQLLDIKDGNDPYTFLFKADISLWDRLTNFALAPFYYIASLRE